MIVTPCKDCQKRFLSCHSTCEDYKNWKSEFEEMKAKVSRNNYLDNELLERKKLAIKKMQHRKHKN